MYTNLYQSKEEMCMGNTVTISITGHIILTGIYNCLFPLPVPCSLYPQQACQLVSYLLDRSHTFILKGSEPLAELPVSGHQCFSEFDHRICKYREASQQIALDYYRHILLIPMV